MTHPDGVLALHLGLRTGWCFGSTGTEPKYGTWRLSEGMDHGEVGAAFLDVLSDHRKIMRPAVIAITSGLTDATDAESAQLAVIQIGLAFSARVYAWRRSIEMAIVNPDVVRDHYLPPGRAPIDERVSSWCRGRRADPKHASAAHALMLWHYARESSGRRAAA